MRPTKTQISLGNPPNLIIVFVVRSVGSQGPKVSSCGQRRLWSDRVVTQADLRLRWVHVILLVLSWCASVIGPRQANLVLIAYASSEGSGEPAHPRSLARTFAARSQKQWIKRNLQTESQIRGPSEWLGMRSWNLSWRNARKHKFAWRGSIITRPRKAPASLCRTLTFIAVGVCSSLTWRRSQQFFTHTTMVSGCDRGQCSL